MIFRHAYADYAATPRRHSAPARSMLFAMPPLPRAMPRHGAVSVDVMPMLMR